MRWRVDHQQEASRICPHCKGRRHHQGVRPRGVLSGFGKLTVKLAFAVLTKAKTPVVQILPVPTDTSRVATMTEAAVQTWSAIVAGQFYPNPGPMNCATCQFKSRCPIFSGR